MGNTMSADACRLLLLRTSTDVGRSLLGRRFNRSLWLGRQLKNRRLLTPTENRQHPDLAVRKFHRIVMGRYLFFVDLPKDRRLVIDHSVAPAQ
jgi:hypothetical protein